MERCICDWSSSAMLSSALQLHHRLEYNSAGLQGFDTDLLMDHFWLFYRHILQDHVNSDRMASRCHVEKKNCVGTLMKKEICLANLLIIYMLENVDSVTHKSQPGQRCNLWLQNDVTCICPASLSPAGHKQRGQSCRTHTHSCLLQLCSQSANHGSRRQPSFSCQGWKQNRWEMKCWDWPDLVDDCGLNSWNWNWAFYTLAAAQDAICPCCRGQHGQSSIPCQIPVCWELSCTKLLQNLK